MEQLFSEIIESSKLTRQGSDQLWKISSPSQWVMACEFAGKQQFLYVDLPGHAPSKKYAFCGTFRGLRDCDEHHHVALSYNSCKQYNCPSCWNDWKARAAGRVVDKIFQYSIAHKIEFISHWDISPPKDFSLDNFKEMELKIKKIFLKNYAGAGFTSIFHAYRGRCLICGKHEKECSCKDKLDFDQQQNMVWEYSPHWHITTNVSFLPNISQLFIDNGAVITKISDIPISNLYALYHYELGHASKLMRKHSIKYWGCWSYRKMQSLSVQSITQSVECGEKECKSCMHEGILVDSRDIEPVADKQFSEMIYEISDTKSVYMRKVKCFYEPEVFHQILNFWVKKKILSDKQFKIPNFVRDLLLAYLQFRSTNRYIKIRSDCCIESHG